MRCVHMINVIFGFQTMLGIGLTFMFTLFTLFASFKFVLYHDVDVNIALSSIFWCFFYNYFFFCIIQSCKIVDDEIENLGKMIYKLLNRNVCRPLLLRSFGNQVKQISGKSTCGLLTFDYQLIMMVKNFRTGDWRLIYIHVLFLGDISSFYVCHYLDSIRELVPK